MFEIGKKYLTVGGWEALVIWKTMYENHVIDSNEFWYTVVHKPSTLEERVCSHDKNGITYSALAVNAPPLYECPHPANLTETEVT